MITKHYPAKYLFRASAAVLCIGMSGAFAGSSGTFTRYDETGNPKAPAAIGRLFTNAGTCSASVISPNNIIATAAHCCFNRSTNAYIGRWVFRAAGLDFPWTDVAILPRWITAGDHQSDLCLIKLGNNVRTSRPVTYHVGWLGRVSNADYVMNVHAVGFSSGFDGSGTTMEVCTAESFASLCGEPNTLNMGCSMTFGLSGAPWIWKYRRGNYITSVVSGYTSAACTGPAGSTFNGPRFNDANIGRLCMDIGC